MQYELTSGPYHCPNCWNKFGKEGLFDVILDRNVMQTVVAGDPPHNVDIIEQERCTRVANWFCWEEGRLYLQGEV